MKLGCGVLIIPLTNRIIIGDILNWGWEAEVQNRHVQKIKRLPEAVMKD